MTTERFHRIHPAWMGLLVQAALMTIGLAAPSTTHAGQPQDPVSANQAPAGSSVQVPAQVLTWQQQADELDAKGRYQEAAAVQEELLTWVRKTFGPEHPATATALNRLALLHRKQGAYPKAELQYRQSLAIREKVLGPEHPDTATTLNNLASLYQLKGAYRQAEPLYQRSLAIREKVQGRAHLNTATALHNLASLYQEQGAYAKAEPLYQRSLAIREQALGPDHPRTALALSELAALFQAQGSYAKALPLLQRSLAILEKALGPAHPSTATVLHNLAELHRVAGAYARAEPLYQRALAIREKVLGAEHPDTAYSLNNLAALYLDLGAYTQAEPLYQRALTILEKTLGADHSATATALNNLASMHQSQGDYAKAKLIFQRVLTIRERALGPEHPATATSLNNLASLFMEQEAYSRAEPLYQRSRRILEKALGPDHPNTATALNNLASLYQARGAYATAEPLYIRTLAIREKALGRTHPDTANSLNNLASLYEAKGAYARAEPLYRRALAIRVQAQGPEHPTTATALNNLGLLHQAQGADRVAAPLLRRGVSSQVSFLQRELPLLPEAQRQKQVRALDKAWEATYTLARRSDEGASLALFTRLNRHGLLQEIEQRQALLARSPGPQQELSQQIAGLTSRLADVNLSSPQRQALQQQLSDLEKQLYRLLPALQPRVVEPGEVARVLPADGVLVEFQRYRPFNGRQPTGKRWGEPRYLALLLFPDGRIASQDLGRASGIEPLIRSALTISEKGEQSPNDAWVQVRDKVLPPALLSQLKDRKQWFLSPDSELSRIPFAALPAPETLSSGQNPRWLAQVVRLRLITSGRDLLPKTRLAQVNAGQALVIANPEFGAPGTPWAPLRATASEGQEIAAQLKATLVTGEQATANALQQVKGPRVLHVASHGFFSDPQASAQPAAIAPQRLGSRRAAFSGPPASTGDPLLNSGIVLSGANRHRRPAQGGSAQTPAASPNGDDDGYLTAKEASRLQLEGTELVVLSACDTASGVSQSGEGVYGLQRALTVAGARATLLSLWKVDDEATAFFMQRYYTLLKAGKGRQEALVQVQEEFRSSPKHKEWKDYRYWAAWQLTGDVAPLPGL